MIATDRNTRETSERLHITITNSTQARNKIKSSNQFVFYHKQAYIFATADEASIEAIWRNEEDT